jgi:hypothetical protein
MAAKFALITRNEMNPVSTAELALNDVVALLESNMESRDDPIRGLGVVAGVAPLWIYIAHLDRSGFRGIASRRKSCTMNWRRYDATIIVELRLPTGENTSADQ